MCEADGDACCTGQRWGQDSLWIHVDSRNTSALRLYESIGLRRTPCGTLSSLLGHQLLLTKSLAQSHKI